MFTREHIIAEIRRTAKINDGVPLGRSRFETETGIRDSDVLKYWARRSDAVTEAGCEPNKLNELRDDKEVLDCLASLAIDLGHFPVANEIKLRARNDPGFPWHNTFARFGRKHELVAKLREHCFQSGKLDVVAICDLVLQQTKSVVPDQPATEDDTDVEFVYMLKSGRHYKVGRTNSVGRRERELAIQLPEKAEVVHYITTDDAIGIEAYWHKRFAEKRKNGEWFGLTTKDVAAFKRRKFM